MPKRVARPRHLEGHWWEVLVNLSMVQRLFGVPHIDDVYWTLTVELAFYALTWLVFVTRKLGRIELLGGLWLAPMAFYRLAERSEVALPGPVANFLLLEHGHLFFAGILFYRFYEGSTSRYTLPLLGLRLAVQPLVGSTQATLVMGSFFALFALFLTGWLRFLTQPPLLFLGAISYSLYVLHQNIGYVVMRELYALEPLLRADAQPVTELQGASARLLSGVGGAIKPYRLRLEAGAQFAALPSRNEVFCTS